MHGTGSGENPHSHIRRGVEDTRINQQLKTNNYGHHNNDFVRRRLARAGPEGRKFNQINYPPPKKQTMSLPKSKKAGKGACV